MQIPIESKDHFIIASRLALMDYRNGHAVSVEAHMGPDGIGRLRVEYSSHGAAVAAIERALGDAAEGHADAWRHRISDEGGWLAVTYAYGQGGPDVEPGEPH